MIQLILAIALLGFLAWLILKYVPMPEPFKTLIVVVIVVAIVLYLIGAFGILDLPVPRLR